MNLTKARAAAERTKEWEAVNAALDAHDPCKIVSNHPAMADLMLCRDVLLGLLSAPLWREKPWEWEEAITGVWVCDSVSGRYSCFKTTSNQWRWKYWNEQSVEAGSLEAAQAACLADYHERLSVGMERVG